MHRFLSVSALLLPLLFASTGHAGGPTVVEVRGAEALGKGDLEAVALSADGVLRVGPAFDAVALEAPTAWAAVRSGAHLWIGTGNEGQLIRVAQGGSDLSRVDTGEGVMVTALAPSADGGVVAAVFPGARLVKAHPEGEVETFASLPAEHVWSLLPDGRGGFLAATGQPGALWAIDAFGAVEKLADVGDDHARCLTRHEGRLVAGTAPEGLVVEFDGGRLRVIRDLEAQEVVALLSLGENGLLVAANQDDAGGNAQKLTSLLKQMLAPSPTAPGQKAPARATLQNGSVLWLEPSGAVTTLWDEKGVAALSLARHGDGAVLGTYPSGRLVGVAPGEPHALLADLPEAEASVLLSEGTDLVAVVTSNPAVLHRPLKEETRGRWTSAPLDAGAFARWGRVEVLGRGVSNLEFRSGETNEPDDTWSEWQPSEAFDGQGGGTGSEARLLQVRATLTGPDARLRRVRAVAQAPNRVPVIEEVTVERKSEKDSEGAERASPLRTITWKAKDPDGDRLRVDLHAQRLGSPHWIVLVADEVPSKPEWTWDTAGLPDGPYQVRLTVSDAPDTPPGRARESQHITPPLPIDNTPPQVSVSARVADGRLIVEGEAIDQPGGRITVVRVSVDGGPWIVLPARDGIYDEAAESFEGSLPAPAEGRHDVVAQARDASDNLGAAATVP